MIQDIKAPITVFSVFDHRKNQVKPFMLKWDGRDYKITHVDLHTTHKNGSILFHVFHVVSDELFFKLVLNTTTQFWTVEQISDGLPD